MTDRTDVRDVLLEKIEKAAEGTSNPLALLYLAEAYAWITNPNQPHGGASAQPKS